MLHEKQLPLTIAIPHDRSRTRTVFGKEGDAHGVHHPSSIGCFALIVNPMFASMR